MGELTAEQVHQRAVAGDRDAQVLLAQLFDRQGRHDIAVGWLRKAADAGHAAAGCYLGARLLSGRGADWAPEDGAHLIYRAAEAGHAEALQRAAALAAVGVGRAGDWGAALDLLRRAAAAGDVSAKGQLAVLEAEAAFFGGALDLARLGTAPEGKDALAGGPRIRIFERFCSPEACDWMARLAGARLSAANTYQAQGGGQKVDQMRTNTLADFSIVQTDLVLALLRARIAHAAGCPVAELERTNVLHYDPGQRFETHYDFINPDLPHFARDLEVFGQRVATALIYLNADYEGGETHFPDIGFRYKGGKGDLMLFFNVTPDGRPDLRTAHTGTAPTRGQKWVLSQWVRNKVQPVI